MDTIKISCAMIVKNEERTLKRCLESIKDSVDEIVVIDTGSTDNTKAIARAFTDKVFEYKWMDDFSDARNYALTFCTGDWIIVIDADEYVENSIRSLITDFISNNPNAVGKIAQINETINNDHVQLSQCVLSRLFPRGIRFTGRVHEQLDTDKVRVYTGIRFLHDGYLHNNKVSRNTKLLEMAIADNPVDGYNVFQLAHQYFLDNSYKKASIFFEKALDIVNTSDNIYPHLISNYLFTLMKIQAWDKGIFLIEQNYDFMKYYADFHFTCATFFMEAAFHDPERYIHLMQLIPECYENCLVIGESDQHDHIIGTGSFLAEFNLAVYYETTGNLELATKFYSASANNGYLPALKRTALIDTNRKVPLH